ncbi:uncharacterized protein EI97DRAFT_120710 [Westerdykella ornata]|uniref:Uncharacterized protein n=1 Tax=Westerdykella ornata TaxID=318751 RepID=A0A6A6JX88_WESOR|nr:uncharacterized protein EI97DRAFT_120710 [Westerdykella ornata]KAF2280346.1 hypothetical protein EI97DRAFT_120710 [Westerdykella ornata]
MPKDRLEHASTASISSCACVQCMGRVPESHTANCFAVSLMTIPKRSLVLSACLNICQPGLYRLACPRANSMQGYHHIPLALHVPPIPSLNL